MFNGILFIPLGFFVKMKSSVKHSVVISGGVSLFIEAMQLITHRGLFEISDLIFKQLLSSAEEWVKVFQQIE